jgi:hypothetical protein
MNDQQKIWLVVGGACLFLGLLFSFTERNQGASSRFKTVDYEQNSHQDETPLLGFTR